MKMEMQMSDRDKKLLIFLTIFVIVVGIGYWGIYPVVKDISKINNQIEEEKSKQSINEEKVRMLPQTEMLCEELENDILKVREGFYPMMSSDEIDRLFTNIVLDYKLYAYDLDIKVSDDLTDLAPYKYSEKAKLEEEEDAQGVQVAGIDNEEFADDIVGVHTAKISLRVGGDEKDLTKFINDLSDSNQMLRVCDYTWSQERNIVYGEEEGDYEIATTKILNVTLEIYMCEE